MFITIFIKRCKLLFCFWFRTFLACEKEKEHTATATRPYFKVFNFMFIFLYFIKSILHFRLSK